MILPPRERTIALKYDASDVPAYPYWVVLPFASFFVAFWTACSHSCHVFGTATPAAFSTSSFVYMRARDFVNGNESSLLPYCAKRFVSKYGL